MNSSEIVIVVGLILYGIFLLSMFIVMVYKDMKAIKVIKNYEKWLEKERNKYRQLAYEQIKEEK